MNNKIIDLLIELAKRNQIEKETFITKNVSIEISKKYRYLCQDEVPYHSICPAFKDPNANKEGKAKKRRLDLCVFLNGEFNFIEYKHIKPSIEGRSNNQLIYDIFQDLKNLNNLRSCNINNINLVNQNFIQVTFLSATNKKALEFAPTEEHKSILNDFFKGNTEAESNKNRSVKWPCKRSLLNEISKYINSTELWETTVIDKPNYMVLITKNKKNV